MDSNKISLENVCCTCLNMDRQLHPLCKITNGVNSLYWLLSSNPEACKTGVEMESSRLHVCWECKAMIRRVTLFRSQACLAQLQLSGVLDGCLLMMNKNPCLSQLEVTHKNGVDKTFETDTIDNFTDCSSVLTNPNPVKSEDLLTELYSQNVDLLSDIFVKNEVGSDTEEILPDRSSDKRLYEDEQIASVSKVPVQTKKGITKEYKCLDCGMCFADENLRWKHTQSKHQEGFKCSTCDKRFSFKNNLERHEAVCGTHSQPRAAPGPRACAACGDTYTTAASYRLHLLQRHASEPVSYKCKVCSKPFATKVARSDHYNFRHMLKTKHKCFICDKLFASQYLIRKHMRGYHGDKPREKRKKDKMCQICGKGFTNIKSVREHEMAHKKERPYSCEVCGDTFGYAASLYTHRRRVHNMRNKVVKVNFQEEIEEPTSDIESQIKANVLTTC